MKARVLALLFSVAVVLPAGSAAQDGDTAAEAAASAVRTYSRLTIFDYVTVRVDAGTATLTGKVTLPEKKEELTRRVAALDGIHRVRDEISVLPTSSSDDALRTRTSRAIYGNTVFWRYAALPHPPIHILVEHGHVTLVGVVPTESERALAQSLATGQGARTVTNSLEIQLAAR